MRLSAPNFQEISRVLIVDDSVVVHGLVASALSHMANVQYDAVTGAAEAMRLLAEKTYALVITDVNMPNINGLELLAFIRQNPGMSRTPVMILSSNGAQSDRDRALRLGAADYLVKPFSLEVLEAGVRRLLGTMS